MARPLLHMVLMRHTTTAKLITSVALSSLTVVLFACSSGPEPTSGNTSSGTARNSSSGAPKNGTSSSGGSTSGNANPPSQSTNGTEPPPAPGACGSSADEAACDECCESKNPGASDVWVKAFHDCVCVPTVCATPCAASECAATPTEPADGDACSTCLANATQCEDTATTACAANAGCAAYEKCYVDSKCETKPGGDNSE